MSEDSPKYRILVVGVGSIGERHLRCFRATGRTRMTFCEPNDKLRNQIAERYEIDKAYSDLDAAISDGCHAAVICTPAQLHVPMAVKLARAGAHLLIEKPLSISHDGIGQLRQTIEQHKTKVAMAYVWRCHPLAVEAKKLLADGTLGAPKHLVIASGQHFPTWRPAYREIYYTKHETGGGAIQDAITHMLNLGESLCGPISKLAADCDHQVLEGVTVEDTVNIITRQGDGVLASYSLNQFQYGNTILIRVACDRGVLELDVTNMRLRWMTEPEGQWQEKKLDKLERDDLFVDQAMRFLDYLDGRAEPMCTLDEGIQTLKVNLAALDAARTGEWRTIG